MDYQTLTITELQEIQTLIAVELRQLIAEATAELDRRRTLADTPARIAALYQRIEDAGGGALLGGLDDRLRHETGIPVHISPDPLRSVAIGAGRCVEEFDALSQVLVADRRR